MSGGYVNGMWMCRHADDPKLVVRIYPDIEIHPFIDRNQEYEVLKLLSERGFFPPVKAKYASFFLAVMLPIFFTAHRNQ